jgi:hypothetical protein
MISGISASPSAATRRGRPDCGGVHRLPRQRRVFSSAEAERRQLTVIRRSDRFDDTVATARTKTPLRRETEPVTVKRASNLA